MPAKPPTRTLLAASLVLAANIDAPRGHAAVMTWSHPGDGSFNLMSNWDLGQVPNHDDGSIFDANATRTVYFSTIGNFYTNQWTFVKRGTWTLDLNDRSLTLTSTSVSTPSLRVAEDAWASLFLRDGGMTAQKAVIADGPNVNGTLTVAVDFDLFLQDLLVVGDEGDGLFILNGGIARSDGLRIGVSDGSSSGMSLGSGASFRSTDASILGWDGYADVSMAGSSAQFDSSLILGLGTGSGHLEMTSGAAATVDGQLRVKNGTLSMDGASTLTAAETLVEGLSTIQIDATSSLTVDDWFAVQDDAVVSSDGVIDVAGATSTEGNGRLFVEGTLRTGSLESDEGVTLSDGVVFELLDDDLEIRPNGPLGANVNLTDAQVAIGGDVTVWNPDAEPEDGRLILVGGDFDVAGPLLIWGIGSAVAQYGDNVLTATGFSLAAGQLHQLEDAALGIGDVPDLGSGSGGLDVAGTQVESATVQLFADSYVGVSEARIAGFTGTTGLVQISDDSLLYSAGDIVLGRSDGAGTARVELSSSGDVYAVSGLTIWPNSVLEMTEASEVDAAIVNHGELRGNGFITDDVINHGVIAPSQSESTVALEITGVLTMKPGSVYACELGGLAPSQRDSIEAHSDVVLEGGVVQMSATNGFEPEVGQLYQIVEGLVTGAFDGVEPADEYELVYGADGVFVQVQSSGCVADLDGSQHVGFDDLAALLGAWGPCDGGGGDCPADLDGSNHVGFDDLAMLLGSWGSCS